MARQYLDVPISTDPQVLQRASFEYLMTKFPGWVPNDGDLETIFVESMSLQVAELRDVASRVPESIFRRFGLIVGILPGTATFAQGDTTWTMIDNTGYTIKAGTQVGIRIAGDTVIPFRVDNDVVVPPGSSATTAGQVGITAIDSGADSSDIGSIGGPVELLDSLDFVQSITLVALTSGGSDGQTDSEYLDHLAQQMQLIAPRPILPLDVELMVTNIVGVDRAMVLDGYNPGDDTFSNERMFAIAPVDAAGQPLSSGKKSEIDAYFEARREVNFIFNVMDPTYTDVDVTFQVHVFPGYGTTDVRDRVIISLTNFFDPKSWGLGPYSGPLRRFLYQPTVRYNEVIEQIGRVEGVDYVTAGSTGLTIGINGGAQNTSDKTLAGRAPLPNPGAITGTAV